MLTEATRWMNFEVFNFNAVDQTQNDKYLMTPVLEILELIQCIEREKRIVVGRGWKEGRMEIHGWMSTEFPFEEIKSVLVMDGGDSRVTMWIYIMAPNCTHKNG